MLKGADLIAPTGKVEGSSMFPDDSSTALVTRMQAYLDEGYRRAQSVDDVSDKDDAARHWAYHRAFEAVFLRLASSPSSVTVQGDGSASYTASQIDHFRNLSQDELALHLELIPADAGGVTNTAPITTTVNNAFRF
jgi:hypothetical protein